jgi:hypothetical protein
MAVAAVWAMPVDAQPITYNRDVSRILQAKCQQCHRAGDIAPFALDSYEAAVDYRDDIKRVVYEGAMPPWKPVAGHGDFKGNFSLTEEERNTIIGWIDTGFEKGDDADAPEPVAPKGDWVLGEPDLVVKMPEAYQPPRGRDMYRCFVLPTDYAETRYVSTVDILPGDRRSVHHVILYLDTTGEAEKLDANEEGPGYTCFGGPGTPVNLTNIVQLLANGISLGGWAPGARPSPLPSGVAMLLPSKARIVMQVHYYTRSGVSPDQTRVGLYFSKDKVQKRLIWLPVLQTRMEIPPGAESHEVKAEYLIPPLLDSHVVNIFPHMHLLGTKISAEIVRGGQVTPLILIDKWDFNWQGPYSYVEPVAAPALSRLRLTCTYNNSESNPRNPSNPLKTVRWGEGTEDEMCLAFMGLTWDRDNLNQ